MAVINTVRLTVLPETGTSVRPSTLPLLLYPYVAYLTLASLRVTSIQRNVICTPVSPLPPPFAHSLHTTTTIVVDAMRRIERQWGNLRDELVPVSSNAVRDKQGDSDN